MAQDFTRGSISRALIAFSFPILLTYFLQGSMQLINSMWVGNLLGSTEFAAVTVGTTVTMVVLAFIMGMNNATLTIFAQLRGMKDPDRIKSYLSTFSLLLVALCAVLGTFGYVMAEDILILLKTPGPVIEPAVMFLRVQFAGVIFLAGYSFIGTALRAFGDSKTPFYFVLLSTVLVAGFGPLFMGVLDLGMAGAAYAPIGAQAISFFGLLIYLHRKYRHHSFRIQPPRLNEIKVILRLGIPSGIQMIVIHAGMTVILSLVNSMGRDAVAGFGAAQRLDNIVLLPAIALSTAVTTMAAQNIGVQKWDRVARIARTGNIVNTSIMTIIAALLFVFAEPLTRLFIQDEGSVAFGTTYLRTIAVFYPFLGFNFIFNGVVRSSGAMFQVLALNIISLWILRVPLAHLATSLYGERGIALGIGISFVLSSLFSIAYYKWGGWRNRELFASKKQHVV